MFLLRTVGCAASAPDGSSPRACGRLEESVVGSLLFLEIVDCSLLIVFSFSLQVGSVDLCPAPSSDPPRGRSASPGAGSDPRPSEGCSEPGGGADLRLAFTYSEPGDDEDVRPRECCAQREKELEKLRADNQAHKRVYEDLSYSANLWKQRFLAAEGRSKAVESVVARSTSKEKTAVDQEAFILKALAAVNEKLTCKLSSNFVFAVFCLANLVVLLSCSRPDKPETRGRSDQIPGGEVGSGADFGWRVVLVGS